jgi:hypothetical protein
MKNAFIRFKILEKELINIEIILNFNHYANEKAQVMFKTWVCKGR